jgi:DNA-binding transcriptional MerR regulator
MDEKRPSGRGSPALIGAILTLPLTAVSSPNIPNRQVFRAQEVCEIADVQPYVLRSWEAEFPDLGVAKSATSPRIYRRADVERVLRIKHLLFVDGLTLAGARKQLIQEGVATPDPVNDAELTELVDRQTREHLRSIRGGLQWILGVLTNGRQSAEPFALQPPHAVARANGARKSRPPVKAKPSKKSAKRKR